MIMMVGRRNTSFMDTQTNVVEIVQPSGILDGTNGNELRNQVLAAIAAGGTIILIDCQSVTFMDSNGFGALITCLKKVREAGGRLALCAINDQVRLILELTGTHQVFEVFSDREAFYQSLVQH
uniref:Anti-sigma factor antagonist n=1 Tax=Cyanothece sp. (strain PCC 7425 / ATCC 29141) TaxID=395961 RepID=B8HJR8_CYAP4